MNKHIMNKFFLFFLLAITSLGTTSFINIANHTKQTATNTTEINWLSYKDAFEANKKVPKKMVIDVYTSWCGWCKKMDKDTWANPDIAKYINENYYAVHLDAEMMDVVTIDGTEYKNKGIDGKRGYHEIALSLLGGKMSFPSVVFIDEKMNILTIVPGYMNAPTMDKVARYFGDGFYAKGIAWPIFEKSYKSRIIEVKP